MERWHRGEVKKSWQRLTAEDAQSSNQATETGGGTGGGNDTSVGECRNELADRVARYQFDWPFVNSLAPLQRVAVSSLFVYVKFNGGSAKATDSSDLLSSFFHFCFRFFFLFAPMFPSPPALWRKLLPILRVVFVRETAVIVVVLFLSVNQQSSRAVSPVQHVSVPLQHVWCSSGNCSLSIPFLLADPLASHSSEHLRRLFCSVLPCFLSCFCSISSFFLLCYGLACCVVFSYVPGTLAFHLLYLDELRLFV